MTSLQIIQLRAPQWAVDPRINDMIALAAQGLSLTIFGNRYNEAIALRVMHIFSKEAFNGGNPGTGTTGGDGRVAGAIISEREGSISRSYANVGGSGSFSLSKQDLLTTSFGMELASLIAACTFCPMNRTI